MSTGDYIPGDNVLYLSPFQSDDPVTAVAPLYEKLRREYDTSDILIVKRFPTGIETFTDRLVDRVGGIDRPRVRSLNAHASRTLSESDDSATLLSDFERVELVDHFLSERSWGSDYLANASGRTSFRRDLGRLMLIMTWMGGLEEPPEDRVLAEIEATADAFQEFIAEHGYMERGQLVDRAVSLLDDEAVRERVQQDFEVIVAIEFEEFAPLDREYLSRLSRDKPLVCLAERESSIQRVWNESGSVTGYSDLSQEAAPGASEQPVTRPGAVAEYLATGRTDANPDAGTVQVIAEATFEDQLRSVADEIQRLRDTYGWSYDEFAIGFKDAQAPINETIRLLRQAGIPTASATVTGFSDDPAVRELHTLATFLATGDETHREQLLESVPDAGERAMDEIDQEMGLEEGLWTWIEETAMKHRIGSLEQPLESRAQFDHVQDVLSLASFFEESPVLEATWEEFVEGLERMFEYTAPDTHTSEVDVKEDGVLVDAVRVMKNASWNAVFMLNVVEGTYPSPQSLTPLFPPARLRTMEHYPGVTTPTESDVRATFATAPDRIDDPFAQYYTELSRRLLAVGSRAASDRLYFGVYDREDSTTGKRTQPSRFLVDLYDRFPWLDEQSHEGIHGQAGATTFALTHVDRTLMQIKRSRIVDEAITLDEAEQEMAAIQELLAAGGTRGDELREAISARVDFAQGRVRNE